MNRVYKPPENNCVHLIKLHQVVFVILSQAPLQIQMVLMDPAANFTRNADRNIKLTKVKSISFHTCTSNSFAFRSAGQLIHPRATPASRRPLADLNVTSATTLTKKKDTYKHNQPRTPLQNDTIKKKKIQIQ